MSKFVRLLKDVRGATAIEYGLLVALIAVAIIGGLTYFTEGAVGMWDFVSGTLENEMG